MPRLLNPRAAALAIALALLATLSAASPALASMSGTAFAPPIAGVGGLLSGIADTVLGGVDWNRRRRG